MYAILPYLNDPAILQREIMACSEDKTKDKCATELYKEIKVNQSEKFQLDLAYTSSVLVYLISKY